MSCAVCQVRPPTAGVLCDDCRDDVSAPLGLVPEQILATTVRRSDAALVDRWGRPHALELRTMIGRVIEGTGLQVLDASVSRHHAYISDDRGDGAWQLRDLGSANGTFLDEQPVVGVAPLRHGARIGIAQVEFYFVLGAARLPEVALDAGAITTVQPANRIAAMRELPEPQDATTESPPASFDFDEREDTDVGMPAVQLTLSEPTGGGGGVLDVAGIELQLAPIQFELMAILVRRMRDEERQPEKVRGFVRSSELLSQLSFDTASPDDNHLKQVIRRLRRSLVRVGIGDLFESRHRFGYRLRVMPR